MSNEPSHEESFMPNEGTEPLQPAESAVPSEGMEHPLPEESTAQPDPHQKVLNAGREAEKAVADSGLSAGLS